MGFLTVNILVVNNLRDINSDRKVSKRTLAVRYGEKAALIQYGLQALAAYGILAMLWMRGMIPAWGLLPGVTIPGAIFWLGFMARNKGKALNKALAGTGQLELVYALLFALGMILSG
jgi:1,4-dihydroxy-2-naphthoate octaprenyltransferase